MRGPARKPQAGATCRHAAIHAAARASGGAVGGGGVGPRGAGRARGAALPGMRQHLTAVLLPFGHQVPRPHLRAAPCTTISPLMQHIAITRQQAGRGTHRAGLRPTALSLTVFHIPGSVLLNSQDTSSQCIEHKRVFLWAGRPNISGVTCACEAAEAL